MSKFCDKCFVDTDKEQHKDWCPNKSDFMSMFRDIFNKDKNKNEDEGEDTSI